GELGPELLFIHAEDARRLLMIAVDEGERLQDQRAIGLFERSTDRNPDLAVLAGDQLIRTEIRERDVRSAGEDHGAFDGVLEFAAGPRPSVFGDELERLG